MPRDETPTRDVHALNGATLAMIADVRRKHMLASESDWRQTRARVARSLFPDDAPRQSALVAELDAGRAVPAGRVLAGAGTEKNVTLYNCFVSPLLQDSMRTDPARAGKGIMDALADVAVSMQMGGGVGTDFSPLRPAGAIVRRVSALASGPLPFMDTWDGMCKTIMSAGYRRGAMMATLRCDHPDVLAFVRAKRDPNRLRMFNVSVLVTDDFIAAVDADAEWKLGHWITREVGQPFELRRDPYTSAMERWYVYETVPARALWREIMENAYEHAEPGVLFLDTANRMNNLWYAEYLQCVNPCGEQWMAPDDACNLGHVNLARCVAGRPFSDECALDHRAIERVARLMVRMSDAVVDASNVPTEAQREAIRAKRRIGLGITGLANAMMFCRLRYGAPGSLAFTANAMATIRDAAYRESIELAKEEGSFPLFDRDKYLAGEFIKTLPEDIRDGIAEHGIRNALLLTIAPTGTVSISQCDNASAGIEPAYAARQERRKLEADGSYSTHYVEDFGFRTYANALFDGDLGAALAAPLPNYMVTTKDLTWEDHLAIVATAQQYVDNSISKTINMPAETSFEEFEAVYRRAHAIGCKGCTVYRPNPASGRGAVLVDADAKELEVIREDAAALGAEVVLPLRERPDALDGRTYRLRYSRLPYPMFLTVNDEVRSDGSRVPFEVFLNSKAVDNAHWMQAVTRMVSAIMRKGGDLRFIPDELKQVYSAAGGDWVDGKYVPSEVALIGVALEKHFRAIGYIDDRFESPATISPVEPRGTAFAEIGKQCPSCGAPAVVMQESCERCASCGWSRC